MSRKELQQGAQGCNSILGNQSAGQGFVPRRPTSHAWRLTRYATTAPRPRLTDVIHQDVDDQVAVPAAKHTARAHDSVCEGGSGCWQCTDVRKSTLYVIKDMVAALQRERGGVSCCGGDVGPPRRSHACCHSLGHGLGQCVLDALGDLVLELVRVVQAHLGHSRAHLIKHVGRDLPGGVGWGAGAQQRQW